MDKIKARVKYGSELYCGLKFIENFCPKQRRWFEKTAPETKSEKWQIMFVACTNVSGIHKYFSIYIQIRKIALAQM